jgi:hypothetical protein
MNIRPFRTPYPARVFPPIMPLISYPIIILEEEQDQRRLGCAFDGRAGAVREAR